MQPTDAFQEGKECLNRGQLDLAEGHFTRALGFFDAQQRGDKKFRDLIEQSLFAVKSKSR